MSLFHIAVVIMFDFSIDFYNNQFSNSMYSHVIHNNYIVTVIAQAPSSSLFN